MQILSELMKHIHDYEVDDVHWTQIETSSGPNCDRWRITDDKAQLFEICISNALFPEHLTQIVKIRSEFCSTKLPPDVGLLM